MTALDASAIFVGTVAGRAADDLVRHLIRERRRRRELERLRRQFAEAMRDDRRNAYLHFP